MFTVRKDLYRKIATAAVLGTSLLFVGCASRPQQYVNACKAENVDAIAAIDCVQARLQSDPTTQPGIQARVDFMAIAVRSLKTRVELGQITPDQARIASDALGRELDGLPGTGPTGVVYVSQPVLEVVGFTPNAAAFNRYVQPSAAAFSSYRGNSSLGSGGTAGGVGAGLDRAPCVTSYCGPVSVQGYYRKDGTYVRPHTRASRGSGRGRR